MALVSSSSSSSSSTTTTHILHRLLRPPPPPPALLSCFLRLLSSSSTTTATTNCSNFTSKYVMSKHQKPLFLSFHHSLPTTTTTHSLLLSPHLSASLNHSLSLDKEREQEDEPCDELEEEEDDAEYSDSTSERSELGEDNGGVLDDDDVSNKEGLKRKIGLKVPKLTVKEKKELASYAHSLGKKLKSQLVGKSGVTDNVASSFIETLEANELLKIKIHRTCPGELEDVVQQLEEATGSVVVSQIGRTLIVYRPSLSKMEAEEKKRQARRMYVRKESKLKPISPQRGQVPRLSGRGRRGSSRS